MLPHLPFKERFVSSRQLLPGSRANAIADLLTSYAQYVAKAGGGAAGAPVLNAAYSELITVVSANDSVALPSAQIGLRIVVSNNGAASANVFPNGTDTAGGAAGAAKAVAVAACIEFVCTKVGVWRTVALT